MSRKSAPPLAKVTRPLLYGAVPRDRLFARLDAERAHRRAVCVVGPPGAGKTTLVASWLDARRAPGLWYQVDAGDADVATFYHYLGQALRDAKARGSRPMPALTAEYRADVAGFSRRFFRLLFQRLPAGSTLVLDNYQEVSAEDLFHTLVADAVEEVPPGSLLIVVSRRDPPDCYSRLVANDGVAFLDWDDLMLSAEETDRIVRARLPSLPAEQVGQLHARAAGWVAGLTLMLEDQRRASRSVVPVGTDRDMLFRYFATNILEALPAPAQRFLVMSAFLPQVIVPVAEDLTGEADAERILEDLCRRHLFTHRRPGTEPVYWYHALFREFLIRRAEALLGPDGMRDTQRRAARLLEARQQFEDGFVLFAGARDWSGAARLIERCAERFLVKGRAQTVAAWIDTLPAEVTLGNPWLRYWRGAALIHDDARRARAWLEGAADVFLASGDALGEALACAAVLDAYFFAWSDFRTMRLWVDRLVPLLDRLHFSVDPAREAKVLGSLIIGVLYAAPDHSARTRCVNRVRELLDEDLAPEQKFWVALSLMAYANLTCDVVLGRFVVRSAELLLEYPAVTPALRLWWYTRLTYFLQMTGEYDAADRASREADELARLQGLMHLRHRNVLITAYRLCVAAARADLRSAQRERDLIIRLNQGDSPVAIWHECQARYLVEALRQDVPALLARTRDARRAAERTGMVYLSMLVLAHECNALALLGDVDGFRRVCESWSSRIASSCFEMHCHELALLEALALVRAGDGEAGVSKLRIALGEARLAAFPFANMFRWSGAASAVLLLALEFDIERDYVVESIRTLGIRPPNGCASPAWPWPVLVRTLGRFEIEVDGVPLTFQGRAPRRSLALLKAIIACGSRDVPLESLVDHLWPDEEGDAARKAAEVALVRLRKLLGRADVIVVSDDRVSLEAGLVWVDADAFEVSAGVSPGSHDREAGRPASFLDPLAVYGGDFLPADQTEAWSIRRRLRLRALMVRHVEALGRHHEGEGRYEEAIACYGRGFETDPLVEAFYQGAMRVCLAAGRIAEGLSVFRRLRDTLAGVLGIAPSAESVTLARDLEEAGRRGRSAA